MSEVIRVDRLSKVYKVYFGPRALLREIVLRKPAHHAITALQGVSFHVNRGEAFGIIGENGAGKSTLLKILTGTAFPTEGIASVEGRVSALLELGAGFHPEFSGRHNIYFSGALMGLPRDRIREREKDIIQFSGLGRQIDHPVKTYSSGMYVRLGFAVATGFDPDILIIDEALAVGDQPFQKKCTDRILDFKRRGKTILFCSHNLYQVRNLCDRTLWLRRGHLAEIGEASRVVDEYTNWLRAEAPPLQSAEKEGTSQSKEVCWIEKVRLAGRKGSEPVEYSPGECVALDVWARFTPEFQGTPGIAVGIVRNDGVIVYAVSTTMEGVLLKRLEDNLHFIRIEFPEVSLLSGLYHFNVSATDQDHMQGYHTLERVEPFRISDPAPDYGLIRLEHRWKSEAE